MRNSIIRNMLNDQFTIVVKTFQGLEEVLAGEIKSLQVKDIQILTRAVSFTGDLISLYKANYHLRTALKVLAEVETFQAKNDVELYQKIQGVDWQRYLDPSQSMAVECVTNSDLFTHSQFIAQRVKDAVVDQLRDRTGKRPRVDREKPDLRISIHIADQRVGVLLDSSGSPLYKRGYRSEQHQAPINEVLAAGLLMLAGYDGTGHLVDPMCGSGTFLIEGAMIAYRLPPGMYRKSFGFENWKNFSQELFDEVIDSVEEQPERKIVITGGDISTESLMLARQSIHKAILDKMVTVSKTAVQDFVPPIGTGWMVTNPPYGERIRLRDIDGFYKMLGDRLKNHYRGYQAWICSGNLDAMKSIGLHPSKRFSLLNGSIPVTFRKFDLYEGSRRARYAGNQSQPNKVLRSGPSRRTDKPAPVTRRSGQVSLKKKGSA